MSVLCVCDSGAWRNGVVCVVSKRKKQHEKQKSKKCNSPVKRHIVAVPDLPSFLSFFLVAGSLRFLQNWLVGWLVWLVGLVG